MLKLGTFTINLGLSKSIYCGRGYITSYDPSGIFEFALYFWDVFDFFCWVHFDLEFFPIKGVELVLLRLYDLNGSEFLGISIYSLSFWLLIPLLEMLLRDFPWFLQKPMYSMTSLGTLFFSSYSWLLTGFSLFVWLLALEERLCLLRLLVTEVAEEEEGEGSLIYGLLNFNLILREASSTVSQLCFSDSFLRIKLFEEDTIRYKGNETLLSLKRLSKSSSSII